MYTVREQGRGKEAEKGRQVNILYIWEFFGEKMLTDQDYYK